MEKKYRKIIIVVSITAAVLVLIVLLFKPSRRGEKFQAQASGLETEQLEQRGTAKETGEIQPEKDRAMTMVNPDIPKRKSKPEPPTAGKPPKKRKEREKQGNTAYRVINTDKERDIFLLSSASGGVYRAGDYDIGSLLGKHSAYSKATEAINTMLKHLGTWDFPEGLFNKSTAFYLSEKLKVELDHGIIPDTVHTGWPLVNTPNQINIPVKFIKNRKYCTGEIIFEKQDAKWYIIEVAVDFSTLPDNNADKLYDDYFLYK